MLKPILGILSAGTFAASVARAPADPFIGEWKLVPARSRMPDEMNVRRKNDSTYAFDFGGSVETIVVNGTDQSGLGGSLLSVKPETPHTWIVERKQGGKLLLRATWKLSTDENTLTDYYREFEVDGSTQSTDYVYRRIGGGSGFAADWQSVKETMNSPYVLKVTASPQGNGLSIVDPVERRTKIVTFDGKEHAATGPNAGRGVSSLRRVSERTIVVTDKYDEKLVVVEELVLSPDLKTLTVTVRISGRNTPEVLVFERA